MLTTVCHNGDTALNKLRILALEDLRSSGEKMNNERVTLDGDQCYEEYQLTRV